MKTIDGSVITKEVKRLVMEANFNLPKDVSDALKKSQKNEKWILASDTLGMIIDNANLATSDQVPMCQDTGMVVVFVELGQEVHLTGGNLSVAINEGIRQGYDEGFLRKSVVEDPLRRKNSGDNTPGVIHVELVSGENLKIMVAPKGFGSENMSRMAMLKPSQGIQGVKDFIIETVELAGPNACPPMVVGVGIGGTFDFAPMLAKKALMRSLDEDHKDPYYRDLEEELLETINSLGIGPQGFGGETTALKVSIMAYPTHIAGLPVAVNINCHATRHKEVVL